MKKLIFLLLFVSLVFCETGEEQESEENEQNSDDDIITVHGSWEDAPNPESSGSFTPPDNVVEFEASDAMESSQDPMESSSQLPESQATQGDSETVINVEENAESKAEEERRSRYDKALGVLNSSTGDKYQAWNDIVELGSEGYNPALITIAWAKLLGTHTRQSIGESEGIFEKMAGEGIPEAQMGLGFLYATGTVHNSSQSKALLHYTFGAFGGSNWAQMALGYRYFSGSGVASSCEKALDYYRRVASSVASEVSFGGGATIQRIRLQDELDGGGFGGILDNDLIEYYQLLADKNNDVQAQVGLGQLHYQGGRGVARDPGQALHYFLQAAESGNAVAMAFLGKIYLEGNDVVAANNETAFKYFKKAANLNNPVGQSGLGIMYLQGKGVDQDNKKAFEYFTKAAEQSWVDGQLYLGNMYYKGLEVKRDYKMAIKYYNLASQSGHVLAFFNLADMHATGTGMLRSCPTAVELYKNVAERGRWADLMMEAHTDYRNGLTDAALLKYLLLAELGYEVAQSNAAFILDRKDSEVYNLEEMWKRALVYWSRAAAQGYSMARVRLGDYYYYGWGTTIDYETAASHYRIASEQQNNAQAMFNLGYMHELGLGMKQDIHLAKRFYDMAADTSVDAKVPVYLALTKLAVIFAVKNVEDVKVIIGPETWESLELYWDLYLVSLLFAALGLMLILRRPNSQRRPQPQAARPQQQQQQRAQQPAAAAVPPTPATTAAATADSSKTISTSTSTITSQSIADSNTTSTSTASSPPSTAASIATTAASQALPSSSQTTAASSQVATASSQAASAALSSAVPQPTASSSVTENSDKKND